MFQQEPLIGNQPGTGCLIFLKAAKLASNRLCPAT